MMLVKFFISSAVFFLSISALDYQPPFLTPTAGTVWKSGGNYSCSWNQTFPEGIHRYEVAQTAKFLLRYKSDNTSDVSDYGNWTLVSDVPLYPPYSNSVNFTLPSDLPYHPTYILILLGSTSDESPRFTIEPDFVPTPVGPGHLPFPSGVGGPGPVSFTSVSSSSTSSTSTGMKSVRTVAPSTGMGMGGKGRKQKSIVDSILNDL